MSWLIPRWFHSFMNRDAPVHVSNPNIMSLNSNRLWHFIYWASTCKFPFSSPSNLLFQSIHHLGIRTCSPGFPGLKSCVCLPLSFSYVSYPVPANPKPVTSESTTTFFHLDHCKSFLSSLPPSYSPKSSFLHISQVIFLAFLCSNPPVGFLSSVLSRSMRC